MYIIAKADIEIEALPQEEPVLANLSKTQTATNDDETLETNDMPKQLDQNDSNLQENLSENRLDLQDNEEAKNENSEIQDIAKQETTKEDKSIDQSEQHEDIVEGNNIHSENLKETKQIDRVSSFIKLIF